jgi:sodium-coupled neutral amino acid transporter 11
MLIIVISVLIEGPHVTPDLKGDPQKRFTIIQPGVFQAIGVISFAFVCHHNSLLIYGSMQTPTLDRFAKVTHISTFISLVACCTLAISAFVVFTDKTMGNILNNFSRVMNLHSPPGMENDFDAFSRRTTRSSMSLAFVLGSTCSLLSH